MLEQGIVTYSNEAKQRYLGVSEETLARYGAVSTQTACEMAEEDAGIPAQKPASLSRELPDPAAVRRRRPVGLVYMGCCVNGKTTVEEYHFRGNRTKIREQAVVKALTLLRRCIL